MHELRLPQGFSGRLNIELSEAPGRIAPKLANAKASETARIVSIRLIAEVYEGDKFRPLTADELAATVLNASQIRLQGESGDVVKHLAPNGRSFTLSDLIVAIEETEQQTRANTDWFGGIDVHHVYFEGVIPADDAEGVWQIVWGS